MSTEPRAAQSLNFAVELGTAWLDVGVPDAAVLDMPVELGLELVAPIGADTLNSEWELADHVIDKVDGVRLILRL